VIELNHHKITSHRRDKMNQYEINAKALEIAINLTGADHSWLHTDECGYVLMNEQLYATFKTVIRAINAKNLEPPGKCEVHPE
jgi:hypothetical protein